MSRERVRSRGEARSADGPHRLRIAALTVLLDHLAEAGVVAESKEDCKLKPEPQPQPQARRGLPKQGRCPVAP